jgi:tRNA G26 N,N-dimethylase Trm1
LIAGDTPFKLRDANEQFKNKFVFYNPKMTFGVDLTIDETQNVFIYMKGRSLEPSGIFQQATRCRNIQHLFFFAEVDQHDSSYLTQALAI